MSHLVSILVLKGGIALALALAATLAGRDGRRPALAHGLWVVALAELLVPPVLVLGVLPSPAPAMTAPVSAAPGPVAPAGVPTGASLASLPSSAPFGWPAALGTVWVAGSLAMLVLTGVRMRRFGRLLAGAADAPVELQRSARELATRLGLRVCPPIRVVPAPISPMLRPRFGSLEVLFPSALLARLSPAERDALIAHELAHVRRGDHRVRMLELAAAAVFWWHPVVWWARRRLRRVEEHCCDALVVASWPERAGAYARGLLETVEFLSGADRGLPCLASGAGGGRLLEERVMRIVQRRIPKPFTRTQRLFCAGGAIALLLILPTWADRDRSEPPALEPTAERAETVLHDDLREIELEALQLEQRLTLLRERQQRLEHELRMRHPELAQREAARLETHALATAERERRSAADRLEMQRVRELEAVRRRLAMLELETERQAADRGGARAEARAEAADELRRRTHGLVDSAELDRARALATEDRLLQRLAELRMSGADRESIERTERELGRRLREPVLRELELRELRGRVHDRDDATRTEIDALRLALEELEAAGWDDRAAAIAERIEILRRLAGEQAGAVY